MRENRLDNITDKLRVRVNRIIGHAEKQFKGTNPYRMEKVPDEERITDYYDFLDNPDIEQQWRMEAGDGPVDKYHQDLRTLINRRMMQNARL